ncbi:hypothetical protein DENIS_1598 [Desulfonema ishimotonii]|uniref:Uncharacterized protein n=1 Tax=Desulfonema ishimotonii TaxID=45657 RepID=A0A401FUJ7_9BACT|nr:hypothetical protein [Desulfonema ishimotonii]GBC60641.1 hypothetical protein DENIS_1598 [Desulfonema ishimotonii]
MIKKPGRSYGCRLALPVILILLLCLCPPVSAETPEEIMKGVLSSFDLPLRDLIREEHPADWKDIFNGLSGNFGVSYPLDKEKPQTEDGAASQGSQKGRDVRLSASVRYNPITYWYFLTTFYKYPDDDFKASWDPDFTYSFGYDDWHPYTLSLVYSNYGGNRFNPDRDAGEKYTRFEEGTINLGFKFTVPRWVEEIFIVHPAGGIRGSLNYTLNPRYLDSSGETEKWKQRLGLNLKYTIYKWIYLSTSFYYYPRSDQQQPWDPDYTYGFGFFDWHPGTLSVQLNNFSGNSAGGNFFDNLRDASLSATWSWAW